MGLSKSEEFSVKDNRIAEIAKALAHPARIAILNILLKNESCICGDITDLIPLAQSTVSQHLKELKKVGLIKGEVEGAKICYCIDVKKWEEAKSYLTEFFKSLKFTNCC